jgi:hypothetical protein
MDHKEPAQLLGLASASMPGSFTTVETAIALLYDSLKVEWTTGGADPKRMPSANFAILASPAARGRPIKLELRGFAQPAGCGSVDLSIGGVQMTVRPTDASFSTRVSAALSADADVTPVIATLNLPKPADGSAASFTLDSIDVSLPARRDDAA